MNTLTKSRTIKCALCGSSNVSHAGLQVFERKEDSETGFHVSTLGGSVLFDTDISRNPSPRRHGFLVHFYCEECGGTFICSIMQHKGQTFIDWS